MRSVAVVAAEAGEDVHCTAAPVSDNTITANEASAATVYLRTELNRSLLVVPTSTSTRDAPRSVRSRQRNARLRSRALSHTRTALFEADCDERGLPVSRAYPTWRS